MIDDNLYQEIKKHTCGDCVYFAQGKNCTYCSHELASEDEQAYRNHRDKCDKKYKFKQR